MPIRPADLLHPTPAGLYCPPGDFYVDPLRGVERAVVTHGHSDHARPGHAKCLATPETLAIMAARMGETHAQETQAIQYGECVSINGVDVSLVPAGHVLGSAQVVIDWKGLRIVVSGDYKRAADPTCTGYELVKADIFVTEATFALPVFRHPPPMGEMEKLLTSLRRFPERTHLVGAYSLGKAQRVIKLLRNAGYDEPIFIHGALKSLCDLYVAHGVDLGDLRPATIEDKSRAAKNDFAGKIVVAPPSAFAQTWARRFADPLEGFASGWMRIRQRAKQRGVELPLVISDHADWDELCETICEVDPQEVWITHGRDDALQRWCELNGYAAKPLALVGYEDEGD
ncbi:ligase-associated DNA damage response exonuclease [Tepidamorphus sp. 3E244]|uniref:ligase-associated DNA damage response exonuclease n=1 Tax=Tepidamorphus sp. 3E244 TaxID=3385498 RepID=UPI0038FCB79C